MDKLAAQLSSLERRLVHIRDGLKLDQSLSAIQSDLEDILEIKAELSSLGLDLYVLDQRFGREARKALASSEPTRVEKLHIPYSPTVEHQGRSYSEGPFLDVLLDELCTRLDLASERLWSLHERASDLAGALDSKTSLQVEESMRSDTRTTRGLTWAITAFTVVMAFLTTLLVLLEYGVIGGQAP